MLSLLQSLSSRPLLETKATLTGMTCRWLQRKSMPTLAKRCRRCLRSPSQAIQDLSKKKHHLKVVPQHTFCVSLMTKILPLYPCTPFKWWFVTSKQSKYTALKGLEPDPARSVFAYQLTTQACPYLHRPWRVRMNANVQLRNSCWCVYRVNLNCNSSQRMEKHKIKIKKIVLPFSRKWKKGSNII